MSELHDVMRRAMEAQGSVVPDEVFAVAELIHEDEAREHERPPIDYTQEAFALERAPDGGLYVAPQEQLAIAAGPEVCMLCGGEGEFFDVKVGEHRRCPTCWTPPPNEVAQQNGSVEHCPWCGAAEGSCGCHGVFLAELEKGHRQARLVAEKLREFNLPVKVTPKQVRRNLADRARFRDEIDIYVGTRPVDVKSSSRHWTRIEEIPFDPVYVDTVRGWDHKRVRPVAVVLISQPGGGMAVVPASTQPEWIVLDTFDTVRGFSEPRYCCPNRLLRTIDEFAAWLAQ